MKIGTMEGKRKEREKEKSSFAFTAIIRLQHEIVINESDRQKKDILWRWKENLIRTENLKGKWIWKLETYCAIQLIAEN